MRGHRARATCLQGVRPAWGMVRPALLGLGQGAHPSRVPAAGTYGRVRQLLGAMRPSAAWLLEGLAGAPQALGGSTPVSMAGGSTFRKVWVGPDVGRAGRPASGERQA